MKNKLSQLDKLKGIIQAKKVFTDEMFIEFKKTFEEIVKNYASEFAKGIEPDASVFNQGFDKGDLTDIDIQLSEENKQMFKSIIKRLTFVKEAFSDKQREELEIDDIVEQGKFSKKMKKLHKSGINGEGTSIGIIDSSSKINESEEFADRDVESIVIDKKDGVLFFRDDANEDRDDFHGKTTASLAAGNSCGIAPGAKVCLFKLAKGIKRNEARSVIPQYIKEHKIELDVLIDPSYNGNSKIFQDELGEKCVYFSVEDTWKNCIWGRYSDDGKELVEDKMAKEIIEQANKVKPHEKGMEDKLKVMQENDEKILIPCTGMTSVQEDFKNRDKYYGSVCGASFPTVFLGSLFALARQRDPNLTKDNFFEIMRNTAKLNSVLDSEALIKEVELLKKQNENQNENQESDKNENMKTGKTNFTTNEIGRTTINTSIGVKQKVEYEKNKNMKKTKDKINEGENLGDK